MSVQIVLKLGDIKGESIVEKHTGEIDVHSWSWGMSQSGSAHRGSGGGTGAANVKDLVIRKWVDKASPNLAAYCHQGTHVSGDVILTCIKVGGGQPGKPNKVEFVKLKMSGTVMVSSFEAGEPEIKDGQPTDQLLETITLHFSKANFDYTVQQAGNTPGDTIPSNDISIGT